MCIKYRIFKVAEFTFYTISTLFFLNVVSEGRGGKIENDEKYDKTLHL